MKTKHYGFTRNAALGLGSGLPLQENSHVR